MRLDDLTEILETVSKESLYLSRSLSLVASESMLMPWIKECLSSNIHSRTIEGLIGERYFTATTNIDKIEKYGQESFSKLFQKKYANIQPHSASVGNLAIISALVPTNGTILSLSVNSGGHISHNLKQGPLKNLKVVNYELNSNSLIDYSSIERLIIQHRPELVISGCSSYPRLIKHDIISKICHNHDSYHLIDIAHTAGLILAGVLPFNINDADIISLSTQKTLLGPRGGVILFDDPKIGSKISKELFPGIQGALMMNNIAAKSACIAFTQTTRFKKLMCRIVQLSSKLAYILNNNGIPVFTGGSDNHIVLVDLYNLGFNVKNLVNELSLLGVICNWNLSHKDSTISKPSAIRFGTISLAQRGITTNDIIDFGEALSDYIKSNGKKYTKLTIAVRILTKKYPDLINKEWLL